MIEKFEFTTNYFDAQIKEANNQFASLTWARLTWEQRVEKHPTIYVNPVYSTSQNKDIVYFYNKNNFVLCETLCQMQF